MFSSFIINMYELKQNSNSKLDSCKTVALTIKVITESKGNIYLGCPKQGPR